MSVEISKHDAAISYKKERRAAVKHLVAVIEAYGYSVWWDDHLRAGHAYDPQIDEAMAQANALIVLWCSLSVKSDWVASEALLSAKRDGNIVPVLIENIDASSLPARLSDLETIPLHRWTGGSDDEWLNKLIRELEIRSRRARQLNRNTLDHLDPKFSPVDRRGGGPCKQSERRLRALPQYKRPWRRGETLRTLRPPFLQTPPSPRSTNSINGVLDPIRSIAQRSQQ